MTILAATSVREVSERLDLDHRCAAILLYVYGRTLLGVASLLTNDEEQSALAGRYSLFQSTAARTVGNALGLGADTVRLALKKLENLNLVDRHALVLGPGSGFFGETGRGPFGGAVASALEPVLGQKDLSRLEVLCGVKRRDALLELSHELAFTRETVAALGCAVKEAGTVTRALYLLALVDMARKAPLDWQRGVPTSHLGMLIGASRGSALAALQALQTMELASCEVDSFGAKWRAPRSERVLALRTRLEDLSVNTRPHPPPSLALKPRLRMTA